MTLFKLDKEKNSYALMPNNVNIIKNIFKRVEYFKMKIYYLYYII